MTHLRKIMLEEHQRRNYSDSTIRHYPRDSARVRATSCGIDCFES